MACGSIHPDRNAVRCIAVDGAPHRNHFAMVDGVPVEWPNVEWVPPPEKVDRKTVPGTFKDLADQVPPEEGTGPGPDHEPVDLSSPIVRDDDPWPAHVAADCIQPTRGTRKASVLARLERSINGWVDGYEIASPDVGGSEGLRRLRELTNEGWPIERRPHPTSGTAWQYRLVGYGGFGHLADVTVSGTPLRDFG